MKSTHILHFPLAFLTNTTFANHLGYWISLMWLALRSFWVSSLMTRCLSSLNFLLLYITGLTFSSMVSLWHKKSGSMSGMSKAVHAKAFKCFGITSTIWSCISWHSDVLSLNFFLLISFSWTSPAGSGHLWRLLHRLPHQVPMLGWRPHILLFCFSGCSHSISSSPFGQTWWRLPLPRGRAASSSCALWRPPHLTCLRKVCPKAYCKSKQH